MYIFDKKTSNRAILKINDSTIYDNIRAMDVYPTLRSHGISPHDMTDYCKHHLFKIDKEGKMYPVYICTQSNGSGIDFFRKFSSGFTCKNDAPYTESFAHKLTVAWANRLPTAIKNKSYTDKNLLNDFKEHFNKVLVKNNLPKRKSSRSIIPDATLSDERGNPVVVEVVYHSFGTPDLAKANFYEWMKVPCVWIVIDPFLCRVVHLEEDENNKKSLFVVDGDSRYKIDFKTVFPLKSNYSNKFASIKSEYNRVVTKAFVQCKNKNGEYKIVDKMLGANRFVNSQDLNELNYLLNCFYPSFLGYLEDNIISAKEFKLNLTRRNIKFDLLQVDPNEYIDKCLSKKS